ncbi:D2 protein [Pelomyxa schiedti]|nr:D2 protein [Pelomyxa schiedti]
MVCRLVLWVAVFSVAVSACTDTVETQNGWIQGECDDWGRAFLGIPYAQAPVGILRWSDPVSPDYWEGVRTHTQFGPPCPQSGTYGSLEATGYSEDCLYLNVYTPLTEDSMLPVMVWIYGGGMTQGWSSDPLYWGNNTALQNVILVSFNYRIGALGFLSGSSLDGNYGVKDVLFALQWVSANIKAFGGDPSKVTLFGQSAGAMLSTIALTSTAFSGLISNVILESNFLVTYYRTKEESTPYSEKFGALVGCDAENLDCLRNVTVESILTAQDNTVCLAQPFSIYDVKCWVPTYDNYLVSGPLPLVQLQNGMITPGVKSVIMGDVQNETVSFLYDFFQSPISPVLYTTALEVVFGEEKAAELLELYPAPQGLHGDARPALSQLSTDMEMICPARQALRATTAYGIPSYSYIFAYPPVQDPMNNSTGCIGQVCHGAELAYVFESASFVPGYCFHCNTSSKSTATKRGTVCESDLAVQVIHSWTQEAATGEPGSIFDTQWPLFSTSSGPTLVINLPNTQATTAYHQQECDWWDTNPFTPPSSPLPILLSYLHSHT